MCAAQGFLPKAAAQNTPPGYPGGVLLSAAPFCSPFPFPLPVCYNRKKRQKDVFVCSTVCANFR